MNVLNKCLESIGYRSFTDFQKISFDAIFRRGFNAILVAPTGSGKTEAAVLPVMYDIRVRGLKPISAIYITPLRALNRDIEERISRLASCFGIRVALKHGDTPPSIRKSIVHNPPHILVTTPESFVYILIDEKLRRFLVNLEYVIYDEFRELIDSKRGYLLFLLTYLFEKMFLKKNLRKIGLTATLKNEDYARMVLSGSTLPYRTIVLREKYEKKLDVEVFVPESDSYELDSRVEFVVEKILSNKGTLVFTNTRSLAEKLCFLINDALDKLGYGDIEVSVHHGSLSLPHRVGVEKGFKNGFLKGLVATSSMELGIDIGNVDYVVQYGSPRQATRLLQRIGRSGHKLGSVSRGAVVVENNVFQILESIVLIRRAKSQDLEVERIYEYPLDVLAYAIVVLTHVFPNGIGLNDIYVVLSNHPQYLNLDYSTFTKLIDYLVESRLVSLENGLVKPRRKGLIYLRRTNMIPETRDYRVVDLASNRDVGVLNEEYVLLELEENDYMVLAGEVWRIVSIDHDKCVVHVEKPIDASGCLAIPHWEGENIPVEYVVAREVGSIIRRLKNGVFPEEYSGFMNVLNRVSRRTGGLGDDREVVLCGSMDDDLIIVNLYGGDRVNRFFRDFFKKIMDTKYPEIKARVYSTPYAIVIASDKLSNPFIYNRVLNDVESIFRKINELLGREDFIHSVAKSSNNYLWRIYQVAQRFGAVDPRVHRVTRRILEAFSETIIGDEALREVLYRDYDIPSLSKLVEGFAKGYVKVVVRECSRDFLREVLEYSDVLRVPSLIYAVRDSYRERVLNRRVKLMCLNCGWFVEGRVKDFIDKGFSYRCGKCGLRALTIVKSDEEAIVLSKNIRGDKLDPGEYRRIEDLRSKSIVLNHYGDLGLIILNARGVGVIDAKSILDRVRRGEDLFSILYEYEKRVIKYKKYYS
ncbi:MAG: DEAD/DEAH box helicase [Desulfurococcaceae archaeon]